MLHNITYTAKWVGNCDGTKGAYWMTQNLHTFKTNAGSNLYDIYFNPGLHNKNKIEQEAYKDYRVANESVLAALPNVVYKENGATIKLRAKWLSCKIFTINQFN